MPENAYGVCKGMNELGAEEALTPWLHRTINTLAGLDVNDRPLTYAQLRASGSPIVLRMITSNLSHNRPYELPLRERIWIAKTEKFREFFPETVMRYLQERAYDSRTTILPNGYFNLPPDDELPVVVAVRMSLSFPLLVSAMPLYNVLACASNASLGRPLTGA